MGQRIRAIGRAREPDRLGRCRNKPIGEKGPIDETERLDSIVADPNAGQFDERREGHTIALTKAPNGASANERQRRRIRAHDHTGQIDDRRRAVGGDGEVGERRDAGELTQIDLVLSVDEVANRVGAVDPRVLRIGARSGDNEGVVARAANEQVIAKPAIEHVGAVTSEQGIVAVLAVEADVAGIAPQHVVAPVSVEIVVTVGTGDDVVAVGAERPSGLGYWKTLRT